MCVYYLGRDFEFHLPRPVARKLFAAARAALAMLVAASAVYAQGGWKELAPVSCPSPVPCPSEGMTVGGVGEMIIGVYGFSRFSRLVGGDQRLTRLYHINRNSWSLGAPAPAPARGEQAYGETTHGDFLYVIGGRSGSCAGGACDNVERYHVARNTWETLTPMPTPRAAAAAAKAVMARAVLTLWMWWSGTTSIPIAGARWPRCLAPALTQPPWSTEAGFTFSAGAQAARSWTTSSSTTLRLTLGLPRRPCRQREPVWWPATWAIRYTPSADGLEVRRSMSTRCTTSRATPGPSPPRFQLAAGKRASILTATGSTSSAAVSPVLAPRPTRMKSSNPTRALQDTPTTVMGMGTTDVNGVFKAPTKQVTEYRWQYLGPATVR